MDMQNMFADRIKNIQASAIREIFKLIGQSDIISLAGGNPAPETFPSKELAEISREILINQPDVALQYGVTDGYAPLKNIVHERMKNSGVAGENDVTVITTGATQAIDLTMRVLVNDGDGIVVEEPSFIGTLNSARTYRAKLYGVPTEKDGMDMEKLEEILKTGKIKMIYTIATFQNPTGITMSLEKRKKLLELASKYNVFILEDNPYGDLRFSGEDVPTIKSLDTEGRVIYDGTFSKILSAGLRIGWVTANKQIAERIVVAKQSNDLHTPLLNQMMAAEYMTKYSIDEHILKIRELYGRKCKKMLAAMDEYFPKTCTYTRPDGGLFLFCTMQDGDSKEILKRAIENKVAFVPGNTFMVDMNKPTSTFRLNYSMVAEDKIEPAIKALAAVL